MSSFFTVDFAMLFRFNLLLLYVVQKNRFPLHYACLLPDGIREKFAALLVEDFSSDNVNQSKAEQGNSLVYRVRNEDEMFDKVKLFLFSVSPC